MTYTPQTWENEVPATTPVKYTIIDDTAGVIAASASIELVTEVTPGTPLDAARMNHIEQGIADVDAAITTLQGLTDELPDFDATGPGSLVQASAGGSVSVRIDNLGATTAPTVGDDSGDGYSIGSVWLDTTSDEAYVCLDASSGAAIWKSLTSGGGVMPTMVKVTRVTSQSIPDSIPTAISWTAEEFDDDNLHVAGSPTRITIAADGKYLIVTSVAFDLHATGVRSVRLYKNGSAIARADQASVGAGLATFVQGVWMLPLVAGDYLELYVVQTSGGALNILAQYGAPAMTVKREA